MVVGVIVSKNARQVDKIFDYGVSDEISDNIQIGSRVIVPFGARSMLCEGYVLEIKDKTGAKRLKSIERLSDGERAFDEKGAELIEWLREKTLCSYIDAVRMLVPTGTDTKFEQWVCLENMDAEKRDRLLGKSEIKRKIVCALLDENGKMEIGRLGDVCNANVRTQINALENAGVVRICQHDSISLKSKTVRFAALATDDAEAQRLVCEMQKKAPRQAKILEILCANERVATADLVYMASASYNALSALEKKGAVEIFDAEVMRDPNIGRSVEIEEFKELTDEQKSVRDKVVSSMDNGEREVFLLHGVTGSGKTEVYMHLIRHAIEKGKTAIVLVPEISLTPLMTRRFTARFGKRVAILHSALSLGERYDEWKRISRGEVDVVVGARSAIFAPLKNIGIIILDEEHEQTYKSEMSPKYHARDVAFARAEQYGAAVVLASATPAVESYYKAKTGEYTLLEMKARFNEQKLPTVYVVDMREELEKGNRSMFSEMLTHELLYNIDHKEQSILFLNRRGFSTFVSCRSCGYVAKCPHCNISLTYHKHTNMLTCHYCGYAHKSYSVCPECGSKYIKYFGAGTQKLEDELKKKFEGVSTVRMDFDTTSTKSAHEKLLDKFEKEKSDVLIGTQMVTKGLDFPSVTLVGVVAADASLYMDDYRSGERTFNLITQVCGRAGRGELEGRAIVQTYTPEHSAIVHAQRHDYKGFFNDEIAFREAMWYPPFCDIVTLLASGTNETLVARCIRDAAKKLDAYLKETKSQRSVMLGPSPSSVSKIKDKFRYRIVVKCENADSLNEILKEVVVDSIKEHKYVSLSVDKNPNSLI